MSGDYFKRALEFVSRAVNSKVYMGYLPLFLPKHKNMKSDLYRQKHCPPFSNMEAKFKVFLLKPI